MVVKKIFLLITLVIFSFSALANTPRSTGKYKNWESFVAETEKGKICFAQTIPTKRAPGAIQKSHRCTEAAAEGAAAAAAAAAGSTGRAGCHDQGARVNA